MLSEDDDLPSVADCTAIFDHWKNALNLEEKKVEMEKSCLEMREAKTMSINGRRRLNDITKTFRAKPKDEQLPMVTELLKAYQEEIDQLSKRSKSAETAYFSIFKALMDAPDPCICMDGLLRTVSMGSTHQLEIERLRSELSQYDEEFQQLKNQDITIRRLEDQLCDFKTQNEEKIAEEVERRAEEIERIAERRVSESREIQRAAEKRLASAVEALRQAQASTDNAQSQLYDAAAAAEVRTTALLSENSLLAEELNRMTLRMAEAESALNTLHAKKTIVSGSSVSGSASSQDLTRQGVTGGIGMDSNISPVIEDEIEALQLVINELKDQNRKQEDLLRSERLRLEMANREVQQQLTHTKEELARVKADLAERPSKEDVMNTKRQLRMLQKIAFNVEDQDGDENLDGEPESTHSTGGSSSTRPSAKIDLETLLANKLKSLETELTETRRELQESRSQEQTAKENLTGAKKSLEQSHALIMRLEHDLETKTFSDAGGDYGRSGRNNKNGDGSQELAELLGVSMSEEHIVIHGAASKQKKISTTLASSDAPSKDIDGGINNSKVASGIANTVAIIGTGGTTAPAAGSHMQMINILQGQRDRYKERLTTAENSILALQQQVDAAVAAKEALESDNLALYSKIRFLQSYSAGNSARDDTGSNATHKSHISPRPVRVFNRGSNNGSGGTMQPQNLFGGSLRGRFGSAEEQRESEDGSELIDVERHYSGIYESKMNPFAEFSHHEKQRKISELSVGDRIVLNTTMSLISSHAGRTFLLVYLGCMHFLVFITMWYFAHLSHERTQGCETHNIHTLHHGAGDVAGVGH